MKLFGRRPEPRMSLYCRCGCQWHGKYCIDNPILAVHARRCGALIPRADFEALGYRAHVPAHWARDKPEGRP